MPKKVYAASQDLIQPKLYTYFPLAEGWQLRIQQPLSDRKDNGPEGSCFSENQKKDLRKIYIEDEPGQIQGPKRIKWHMLPQ